MSRLTAHQQANLRVVITDDTLYAAALAVLEKPEPRPLTQYEVEAICQRAAGMDSRGNWKGSPKPLKMRMKSSGEVIETGWQNVSRAIFNGVATLVDVP